MYDYGLSTLSRYPVTLTDSFRVRGALMCRTGDGLFLLREFHGSAERLEKQQMLLEHLTEQGFRVDAFVRNDENALVTEGQDGRTYTLCRWYDGKECDPRLAGEIRRGTELLAGLHKSMQLPAQEPPFAKSLEDEYRRHNQELRKIRKFIYKKGPSGAFETAWISSVEMFLKKGEEALELLQNSGYQKLKQQAEEEGRICHGAYNQHQILISGNDIAAVNFSSWNYGIQISDLYDFMRKILEKHNWDPRLALDMLRAYHKIRPILWEEWENLRIRFTYPEKYWKLANFYYTRKKAWISEQSVEKLRKLIKQREAWENCIQRVFSTDPF